MEASRITHKERLQACLAGEVVDRPPVAFWRHFPVDDQSPDHLAASTIDFQRAFDFDLVKVTPASSFCLKDWGVLDEWRGASEGTRDYTYYVVDTPRSWEQLPILDPTAEYLAAGLACLHLITRELGPETPVIQTIFNPLSQAKHLVDLDQLQVHIRRYPEAVHAGLKTITETTIRFLEAARQTGIAGIFYAVQHAAYGLLSEEEYNAFGRPYDLQILESVQDLWLNMLHIHGDGIMFNLLADYPVGVINWHDRETSPTLAEGLERFSGAVCGGLQRIETMVLGDPEKVAFEARDAIQATGGRRFILGTGCVLPITTPRANILAARQSVATRQ